MDVRFYHLEHTAFDQAVPALILKAMDKKHKIIMHLPDETSLRHLDDHLWTCKRNEFIAHGTAADELDQAADTPLWLTTENDNPNQADMLISGLGADIDISSISDFSLICVMFDGRDNSQLKKARQNWKDLKSSTDINLTYWKQTPKGGWEQAA